MDWQDMDPDEVYEEFGRANLASTLNLLETKLIEFKNVLQSESRSELNRYLTANMFMIEHQPCEHTLMFLYFTILFGSQQAYD
jgi:hypothetical protein